MTWTDLLDALYRDSWNPSMGRFRSPFAFRGQPSHDAAHVLLGLWAFAMGMQSAAVRSLHVDGVFTTAATATFIFLMGDFVNSSESAEERRRLWGVLIFLVLGALAGGLLLVHARIYAPVLSFVVTILVVITAAIAFRNRAVTETAAASIPPRAPCRSPHRWSS